MILPPATLGVLGGGQLGRYFVMAAHELGYRVVVLDPDRQSTAGRIADEHIVAAYDEPQALERMASICVAVTTEFESVPAAALATLARFVPVRPDADAVAICQERSAEKRFLKTHGFPHVPYAEIRSEDDIRKVDAGLFPAILKVARCGYDGKGQQRVAGKDETLAAFRQFDKEPCVLERQVTLDYELSLVLTPGRERGGQVLSGDRELPPPRRSRLLDGSGARLGWRADAPGPGNRRGDRRQDGLCRHLVRRVFCCRWPAPGQ